MVISFFYFLLNYLVSARHDETSRGTKKFASKKNQYWMRRSRAHICSSRLSLTVTRRKSRRISIGRRSRKKIEVIRSENKKGRLISNVLKAQALIHAVGLFQRRSKYYNINTRWVNLESQRSAFSHGRESREDERGVDGLISVVSSTLKHGMYAVNGYSKLVKKRSSDWWTCQLCKLTSEGAMVLQHDASCQERTQLFCHELRHSPW